MESTSPPRQSARCRECSTGFLSGVGIESGGYSQKPAEGDETEFIVRLLEETGPTKAEVRMIRPRWKEGGRKEITLLPGERKEVEFGALSPVAITGRVTDARGAPIADALVYVGDQITARGDELFKPFMPDRIVDGARTDAAGRFTVRGDWGEVTAWHPDYTPVTVSVDDAEQILLPDRGAIRGRLVDAEGAPLEGKMVVLDRTRNTRTDAGGGFNFHKVEAGARGLFMEADRMEVVVVRVKPGETTQVDIDRKLPEVRVEVVVGGTSCTETLGGGLVGLGEVSRIHHVEVKGGTFTLHEVLPGRYLFGDRLGRLAELDIQGSEARVDLGDARLTVHAPPGEKVCILPAGAGDLIRLMAVRMVRIPVPESGFVRFSPLPRGKYEVGLVRDDRLHQRTRVEVTGPETEVGIE